MTHCPLPDRPLPDRPLPDRPLPDRRMLTDPLGFTGLVRFTGLVGLFAVWFALVCPAMVSAQPPRIIFDTDIGNDCDDVLAMGMLHSLQSRGECELLAVTVTKDHPLAAAFADCVNTFYGRGDIPIGVCRGSGVTTHEGRFNSLAMRTWYPHDLTGSQDAPDAVEVLRRTLSGAKDKSVVILQVGFSTNLANLLRSPGDELSPLPGVELVESKVQYLSAMFGAFERIVGDTGHLYDHHEYNVVEDIASAKYLVAQWPTPIRLSGFEIGIALPYPHESILNDFRYVDHHPLAEAYTLYQPPPHDRPTWDLTNVLQAVRPGGDYFELSPPGVVRVADDGLTSFEESPDGRHRIFQINETQKVRVIEAMRLLASEPPHVSSGGRNE